MSFMAGGQDLSCSFTSVKTIKVSGRMIPGKGKVTFTAPDKLLMDYDMPQGEFLHIEGNILTSATGGKPIKIDTSKSARFRKMRDSLLGCIMGNYEKVAADNDANLVVEKKGNVTRVGILAKKPEPGGYSRIVVDYNAKGLPVKMLLEEFVGITTEFDFQY